MCCCCWEKYSKRSKSWKKMNKNLDEQIQLFIFPGYLMNNKCYPSVVMGAKEICIDLRRETLLVVNEELK